MNTDVTIFWQVFCRSSQYATSCTCASIRSKLHANIFYKRTGLGTAFAASIQRQTGWFVGSLVWSFELTLFVVKSQNQQQRQQFQNQVALNQQMWVVARGCLHQNRALQNFIIWKWPNLGSADKCMMVKISLHFKVPCMPNLRKLGCSTICNNRSNTAPLNSVRSTTSHHRNRTEPRPGISESSSKHPPLIIANEPYSHLKYPIYDYLRFFLLVIALIWPQF